MIRFPLLLLSLLLSLLLAGCQPDWVRIDSAVIRLSVVEDGEAVGHGSAFAINDQGEYVTNYHVVEPAVNGAGKVRMMAVESLDPLKLHAVTVLATSKAQDLAVVRVSGLARPALMISAASVKGEAVRSIGFPGGIELNTLLLDPQRSAGGISGKEAFPLSKDGVKVKLVIHNATLLGGNSGGPLLDTCGRVVGVNVAKTASNLDLGAVLAGIARLLQNQGGAQVQLDTQEGFFFAIDATELLEFLSQQKVAFSQASGACRAAGATPPWLLALLLAMFTVLALLGAGYWQLRRMLPDGRVNLQAVSQLIRRSGNEMQADDEGGQTRFVRDEHGRPQRVEGSGRRPKRFRLMPEQRRWPSVSIRSGERVVLGRDPNHCTVSIEGDLISRQHLELFVDPRGDLIGHDLGSSNGSYVDHEQLPEARQGSDEGMIIRPGRRLILGSEDVVYRIEED